MFIERNQKYKFNIKKKYTETGYSIIIKIVIKQSVKLPKTLKTILQCERIYCKKSEIKCKQI